MLLIKLVSGGIVRRITSPTPPSTEKLKYHPKCALPSVDVVLLCVALLLKLNYHEVRSLHVIIGNGNVIVM